MKQSKLPNRIALGPTGNYIVRPAQKAKLGSYNRLKVEDWPEGKQQEVLLNPQILTQLDLFEDDFVQIMGRYRHITHCLIKCSEDVDFCSIRMSKQTRLNCEVNLSDIVILRQAQLQNCQQIKLFPYSDANIGQDVDIVVNYIAPYFKNMQRCVSQGDRLILGEGAQQAEFQVVLLNPVGSGVTCAETQFFTDGVVDRELQEKMSASKVSYEDLGGLEKELEQIKEMVLMPLLQPHLFKQLGISAPKGVLLHGPPGCGKTSIGKAVATESNAHFELVNSAEIFQAMAGESEKMLKSAFMRAQEASEQGQPAIVFIDEIDVIGGKREELKGETEKRVVSQLLTLMDGIGSREGIIVIAATNRPNSLDPALRRFGRFDREIVIGVPSTEGRKMIFEKKTAKMKLDADVDLNQLAEDAQGFVGADISQVCMEAGFNAIRDAGKEFDLEFRVPDEKIQGLTIKHAHFRQAMQKITPSTLREMFVEVPKTEWKDIGGLEEVKEKLLKFVQYPIQYPEFYEKAGITSSRGCMLCGPPGNGKTLLAKAIAHECNANFISVKGPELLSMWVGESERGVRTVFDKARQSQPCIIFMDEIDSIAHVRGGQSDAGVGDRVLNQLLTEIDGVGGKKNVFVIGATNRLDTVDPALLRGGRLDQIIYVDLPDLPSRMKILQASTRKARVAPNVYFDQIAKVTQNYSAADLAEICQKAVQISMDDMIKQQDQKIKQLIEQFNQNPKLTNEEIDQQIAAIQQEQFEIQQEHFAKAVRQSRQSTTEADLKKYEQQKKIYCDAEHDGLANSKLKDFNFSKPRSQEADEDTFF